MRGIGNIKSLNIKVIVIIIALISSMHTAAQEKAQTNFLGKLKGFTTKTVDFIGYVLNDIDTLYVEKSKYNLTVRPAYSYSYENYMLGTTGNAGQSIGIVPDSRNVLRLNFGWRWLIVGYSIDLQKNRPLKEFNTSLYSTRFGLDLLYRKGSEGYHVNEMSGLYNGNEGALDKQPLEDVLTVKQLGVGLHYAFNKRFSYSAAYGQTTIQRASAGSLVVGAGYNWQEFTFDHARIESATTTPLHNELLFDKTAYNDISISVGYAYNWVFARNMLAGISVEPAISYKHAKQQYSEENRMQHSIAMDFTTRAALLYNNNRYYAGASYESHAYCYHKKPLYMANEFGVLEIYAGFYFWRRK